MVPLKIISHMKLWTLNLATIVKGRPNLGPRLETRQCANGPNPGRRSQKFGLGYTSTCPGMVHDIPAPVGWYMVPQAKSWDRTDGMS